MNKQELIAELEALGVEFDAKATKAELEALYAEQQPATEEVAPAEEIAEAVEEKPAKKAVKTPKTAKVVCKRAQYLALRNAPDGDVVGRVDNGSILTCAGKAEGKWQPVQYGDNVLYVSCDFLA